MTKLSIVKNTKGFSLVEIILAVALFGLFATALIGLLMDSYGSNFQAEEKDKATLSAQEGLEAVFSIRRQAWNLLENGNHGLDNASGYWQFSGTADSLDDGKYTRVINISDTCRSGGSIVNCPSGTVDLHTKKVTSTVTYTAINRVENQVELTAYLTTWQSKDWIQTDWSGGSGQSIWSGSAKYNGDDGNVDVSTSGQVTLEGSSGGCGMAVWPFSNSSDYTYNPDDIEVTGGFAQLKGQANPVSGGTTNPGFDSGSADWTYADWNQGCGEVNVTGVWQSTGGNPDGYVYINIPSGSSDELGGFWRQPFTTTVDNTTVNVNFDWLFNQYNPTPITFKLYVFVDSASGAPVIGQEVWSSPEITTTNNWTSVTDVDATARVSVPGTYYLKVAVWVETPKTTTGPFQIGYDNVSLTWTGGASTYPTNNPPINPNTSLTVSGIDQWSSFSEVAIKNSGEVYYQLSDDEGITWRYWSGSAWAVAGSVNYNTAAVVNTNISFFPTSTAKIMFKAFLDSNNNEQVQLDEVKISCAKIYPWPFSNSSDYTYNPDDIEVTGGFAQLKGQANPVSGGTTNPGFDSGSADWTYADWNQGGGEVNVTGVWQSTGGNPDGYVYINIPSGSSDELGGFWRQPFTTTVDNTTVNVNFDWLVNQYNPTPITFKLYVFVDSASGAPVIGQEVWSSPEITTTNNWTSVTDVDATARVSVPGTYYLKVAVWVETPKTTTGPFQIGYDNVSLTWTGGASTYPTNNPPINPNTSLTVSGIDQWSSFSEVAIKNSGEVYYQLSDDEGITWRYWNGNSWVTAGANQYNIASQVDTNISSFPTSTAKIMFKAFLSSTDGQQVQLDEVQIGWGERAGVGYATFGWLESSAFNTGGSSSFNFSSWIDIIPSVNEDIKIQIATAPDVGGSPGSWSAWTGLNGAGTYYTSGDEILIPLAKDRKSVV